MGVPLTEADYALSVDVIRITMHNTGLTLEPDNRTGNHASIFLLTGNQISVRLNMTLREPTDIMGTYYQDRCLYEQSRSSFKDINLRAVEGLNVGHVIRLIAAKGRHKYMPAPTGVGCRFWM